MFRNAISDSTRGGGKPAGVTPLYPDRDPPGAPSPRPPPSPQAPAQPDRTTAAPRPSDTPAPWLEQTWDMAALIGLLASRWRLIAGALGLGLLMALLLLAQWPRAYTAEAVILIDPESQPKVAFEELLTGTTPDDQRLSSEVLVLRAPDLAAHVVKALSLTRHPDFNPDLPQPLPPYAFWLAVPFDWVTAARRWLGLDEPDRPIAPEAKLEGHAARVLAAFADRLAVERIGRSHAVRVAVTSHNPDLAADTANAVADRYLAGQLEAKHAATVLAGAWLDKRVTDLRAKAEAAERVVETYRIETGLIDANGTTVTTQQLGELNTQLIIARAETAAARARLSQVRSQVTRPGDALASAEVLASPLIHRLKEQEVEVMRRRADLTQEFGPKHPRMLSVQAELGDIQAKIASEVHQIVAGLSSAVAVAEAQEAALAAALRRTEAAAAEQGKAQVRLHALEREAEASRTMLQTFLQRTKQTSDQQDIQRPDARIIARAQPPEKPSEPRQALVMAGAGVGSLLLGLAAALILGLREQGYGNRGFGTPAALRAGLGLPVLGVVPELRHRRGTSPADQVTDAPFGAFAEAARMVAAGTGGAQVVLVTASLAGEGKTTLALALARTLAAQGGRVLLVDADLRRAGLSIALGLDRMPGLAEALAVSAPAGSGCPLAGDRARSVQILPAGLLETRLAVAGQPADALGPWLAIWREQFHHIILDAAPTLLVAEAAAQARLADAVLLAVRWRSTPCEAAAEAAQRIRDTGAPLTGAVLTRVDTRRLQAANLGYGDVTTYSNDLYRAQARRQRWWRVAAR